MTPSTQPPRPRESVYLHWARTQPPATHNLATSGVASWPLERLPGAWSDLELTGPSTYGYAPLVEALAELNRTTPDRIFTTSGTSMANQLAMAAILEPGDEVLIEAPTYEPLLAVASYLGATIRRFERRIEEGFEVDADDVLAGMGRNCKLVVISNLHNPSSNQTSNETLIRIGAAAAERGAKVLVDEVYLDTLFENTPPSAATLGDAFIVTNSLTKVYGLSGLRCGWVYGEPQIVSKLWRFNDLFDIIPPFPAQKLSVLALKALPMIRDHYRALLAENRSLVSDFLRTRKDLEATVNPAGTVVFPKLLTLTGDVDAFASWLRTEYQIAVVPGRFFEVPERFRIGYGGHTPALKESLSRLGQALDDWQRKPTPRA